MDLAVIGCGRWGKNVIRTLIELEDSEEFRLKEVVHTGNPKRAKEIQERFRFDTHAEVDEALERNEAVCVVTPDDTHTELTRRCLRAGLDVFVEKPLAFDRDEAEALYDLAEAKNCRLMPGHLMVFHPLVSTLRTEPDFDPGTLDEIAVNRMSDLRESGERRLLHSSLIHDVTVLDSLFEEIPETTAVREVAGEYPPGRFLSATLGYNDVSVRIRARTDWPYPERSMVFRDDNQFFRFDGLEEELRILDQSPGNEQRRRVSFETLPLTDELKNFIRSARGEETVGVTRKHVLRTMKTLDTLQEKILSFRD